MDIITAQAVFSLTYQIKDIDCRWMWQPFWWRCFSDLFSRKFMIIAPKSAMCHQGCNLMLMYWTERCKCWDNFSGIAWRESQAEARTKNSIKSIEWLGHFLLNRFEIFSLLKFCHRIRENCGLVCRCPLQIGFAFRSYPHILTRGNDNGIENDVGVKVFINSLVEKKRLASWVNFIILPHTRTLQKIVSAYQAIKIFATDSSFKLNRIFILFHLEGCFKQVHIFSSIRII